MRIAQIKQCPRVRYRKIDGRAISDFVEIHVPAVIPRVTGGRSTTGRRRRCGNAAEHRMERDCELLQVLRSRLRSRSVGLQVQMPPDRVSVVAGLDGQLWAQRRLYDAVV